MTRERYQQAIDRAEDIDSQLATLKHRCEHVLGNTEAADCIEAAREELATARGILQVLADSHGVRRG